MNLEIERVKGEIFANRGIAEEQRSQAVENIASSGLKRAKTMAEIQDLMQGRINEYFQLAIQLEGIKQQNLEVKAKS